MRPSPSPRVRARRVPPAAALIALAGLGLGSQALAANAELRRLLERAIQRLPEQFRTAFMLREVEGLSVEETAEYLGIPHILGVGDLTVLLLAVVGACLAFLWFNAPPAAVFMGDTGSLALGGALGAVAVATHHEFVLVIVGGLFVLEALSVIIQVAVYKRTGKRVFLMAPIHHHFEHLGWSEPTVVIRFWIISFVLALAGLSTLKLR